MWVVEHMAEMESLYEHGDLDFESFLGVGYLYGSAALSDIEVVDATGVRKSNTNLKPAAP